MRKVFLLASMLAVATAICAAQGSEPIRATTASGRQVILKSDGTWSYVEQKPAQASTAAKYSKSAGATKKVAAPHGPYALWIDPKKWSETKGEKGKVMLESVDGSGFAMIISDAIPVSTSTLRELALHNAQELDPNAQITMEEKRLVNGHEVLCLQLKAIASKIPFTYYGYYFGGAAGNLQLVSFTTQNQFPSKMNDFTELLNGLEIDDTPLPETPQVDTISVNDDKIKLTYDTRKWSAPRKDKDGRIKLSNEKANGWALVIPESVTIPIESLTEIALNNAKDADPNAKITFREKRMVHGREVWCLKIAATISKIPFTYYGYYYSGTEGTVQVLTYTTTDAFKELEPEFTELLNSLEVAGTGPSAHKAGN